MNRFEQDLTGQLGDLADDLAGGPPPSADAAISRHHRSRRNHVGVTATVLAVALVVGIPVGLSTVGAPGSDVAGERPTAPPSTAAPTATPTPTPTTAATPTAPQGTGQATPTDAAWQARLDEATGLAAQLPGPIAPTVPTPFTSCPDIAGDLSTGLGVEIAPDGGENGSIEPTSGMCLWATPDTVDESADPPTRYGSTIRFMPDVGVDDVRDRLFVCDQGGPCPTVDAPAAGEGAFLVSNLASDFQTLDLVVPDASGAGIWVIEAYRGTSYPGPALLDGLIAASSALNAALGAP